ncbi:MAG TPA: D-hexose-6-phosphate mutarotase [Acidobacteriaceae bacterium]
MNLTELNHRFGIAGVVLFDEDRGFTRLRVTSKACAATIYLQGAHLTAWQPAGTPPVIFLSRASDFTPGKPLRGGVPVVFPWFATDSKPDRIDGHPGPSHGFARLQEWSVNAVHHSGPATNIRLTLGPTDMSRSMGFDHFLLTMDITVGTELRLQFTVHNQADAPLKFEEALHAYFQVVDVHEATVSGLEPTPYIDKTDHMTVKPAAGKPITFTGPVDRVYKDTAAPLTIHDGAQSRAIHVIKSNSMSTVVWNPGKAMPDLGEWDWHEMLCVETANVDSNARTLKPSGAWQMGVTVRVEPLKG